MKDLNAPIAKSLARHVTADELKAVSGAATVVRTEASAEGGGDVKEDTYKGNSPTPSGLDTVISTLCFKKHCSSVNT